MQLMDHHVTTNHYVVLFMDLCVQYTYVLVPYVRVIVYSSVRRIITSFVSFNELYLPLTILSLTPTILPVYREATTYVNVLRSVE